MSKKTGHRILRFLFVFCFLICFGGCGIGNDDYQVTTLDEKYVTSTDATGSEEEAAQKEETDAAAEENTEAEQKQIEKKPEKKTAVSGKPQEEKEKSTSAKPADKKKTEKEKHKKTDKQETSAKEDKTKDRDKSSKQKDTETSKDTVEKTCTVYIECKTILENMDKLKESKTSFVPKNGVILEKTKVSFEEGESVYDVLYRICRKKNIHFEAKYTPAYHTYYIEGIHQLYEFDCGNLSGWVYLVNGEKPNYGCSGYKVSEGDAICWSYTCNAGKDVKG